MKFRRPQMVLIAFAIAAWLGAMLELGAAARAAGGPCQQVSNCGETYIDGARSLVPDECERSTAKTPETPSRLTWSISTRLPIPVTVRG